MPARLEVVLSDDLDRRFRSAVAERFGLRKGSLKTAATEAIECWTNNGGLKG